MEHEQHEQGNEPGAGLAHAPAGWRANRGAPKVPGISVITAGTTLLSVIALYLFGGEVLEGFAFTMLVGIISGTYSTVFIAASLAIVFQGNRPMKGQAPTASTKADRPSRRRAS